VSIFLVLPSCSSFLNNGFDDAVADDDECHEGKFNGQGYGVETCQTMANNCVPHAAAAAAAASAATASI